MSIPWQDFISRLESPPDSLSTIPKPRIDNEAQFTQSLLALPLRTSVYGATHVTPTPAWSRRALEWATLGCRDSAVEAWISRALASQAFESEAWIEALADDGQHTLRHIFVRWGQLDMQSLLSAFHIHFLPANRPTILTTLIQVLHAMPHVPGTPANTTAMYTLACHPFLDTVLTSLLLDTGNKLFPLGLRTILNIIPYAPQVLTSKVPQIMVVLGRAVCWRDRPFVDADRIPDSVATPVTITPRPRSEWAVATSAMEQHVDLPPSLQPINVVRLWLVAIHGAWPSNLLAFVRDPVTYLRGKHADSPYEVEWEEVWPKGLLAARAGPLMRNFSLHPSIMYFNSDGELQDAKRWDKIDPAEHVARAHIIAHSEHLSHGKTDFFDDDPYSAAHDVEVSRAPTPETRDDSPPLATSVQQLQRENMLLRLEAGYADRLRKQYLYHIGRLHKHSMRFSVDEAEVHNFANIIKEKNSVIRGLKEELDESRDNSRHAKTNHRNWQSQQRDKMAKYRDEKSNWQAEAASLRNHSSELETTVMRQKAELAQVKNECFTLRNQVAQMMPNVQKIEDYKIRDKQFTDAQRLWDRDVAARDEAVDECDRHKARTWQLEQMLRAMRKEHEPSIVDPAKPRSRMECTSSRCSTAHTTEARPQHSDFEYLTSVAKRLQAQIDHLERLNLELEVKLAGHPPISGNETPTAERALLWGE